MDSSSSAAGTDKDEPEPTDSKEPGSEDVTMMRRRRTLNPKLNRAQASQALPVRPPIRLSCTIAMLGLALAIMACKEEPTKEPPPTVASIEVAAMPSSLRAGASVALSAVPLSEAGSPLTGRKVEWKSSQPDVLAIASASAEARKPGKATVTATVDGVTSSREIRVIHPLVGWWQATNPGRWVFEVRSVGDTDEVEAILRGFSLGEWMTGMSRVYWHNDGGKECILRHEKPGRIFFSSIKKVSKNEWRAEEEDPQYSIYRGGRRCTTKDSVRNQISIRLEGPDALLKTNLTKGHDPTPYRRVDPETAQAMLAGKPSTKKTPAGEVTTLHSVVELKKNPEGYKGKTIKIVSHYSGRKLSNDVGRSTGAPFEAHDFAGNTVRFRVLIPEGYDVTKLTADKALVLTFTSEEGSLTKGNKLVSLSDWDDE